MEENKYMAKPQNGQQDDTQNIRDLFRFIWGLRYWIIAFGLAALIASYIWVKFQTPVYERKSQIMLVDEKSGGSSEMSILQDITGLKQSSPIDNEVFILRSPSLMTKVVDELNLNYRYYSYSVPHNLFKSNLGKKLFGIRENQYYNDAPFELVMEFDELYPESELPSSISFTFRAIDANTFDILEFYENRSVRFRVDKEWDDKNRTGCYNAEIVRHGYKFRIVRKESASSTLQPGSKYRATWSKSYNAGTGLAKNLTVNVEQGVQGKTFKTNVITMTMHDSNIARADDILNMLTVKYMEEAKAFKNKSVISTIEFLDKRLETISADLGNVESSYRNYQQSNTVVNIDAQSQLSLTSGLEYENQLTEIRLQQQILAMIKEDLSSADPGNFDVIPSNIGLTDAGLNQVIGEYNALVAERNRLIANSSANNPRVRNLDLQLADFRNSIVMSVENLDKVYNIRAKEVSNVLRQSQSKISDIPTQQFDLAQIERRQQIIEPLYLLLQQKREEAQISMYAVSDNVRVIEQAYGSNVPISPKNMQIYLLALILGCCIPPLFVYLRNLLRNTVQTREDIEAKLNVPILATLPKVEDARELISANSRDLKSESFRMLRSNLKFLKGNVIQVTSSNPSEGKSYVASNLALSLSHTGSKVLLVGLDLRKPALMKIFTELEMQREHSAVAYLIGMAQNPADTILDGKSKYGIDIAFSGIIPPNPTELLSTERLEQLISWYREHYDYVIIDSAPMMPVSDSILLNRYVDTTLYVVRSEYTPSTMLEQIAKLFYEREIKSPNIVLNSVDLDSNRLRYGYGYGYGKSYGYGKGYGYGYSYGYGDDPKGSRRRHGKRHSDSHSKHHSDSEEQ